MPDTVELFSSNEFRGEKEDCPQSKVSVGSSLCDVGAGLRVLEAAGIVTSGCEAFRVWSTA